LKIGGFSVNPEKVLSKSGWLGWGSSAGKREMTEDVPVGDDADELIALIE